MGHYVITIARGFGSGGKSIAMGLANELGIECYEHRILALASQYSGYDEAVLANYNEKIKGSYFMNKIGQIAGELGLHPMNTEFHANQIIFDIQSKIIRELAETQSCIIVGKCADYILKDYPDTVKIYIEAPREYCRKRIMKKQGVDEKQADQLISSTDKYRAEYYQFYTNGNYWTNPINYDMTLNSEKIGHDNCIRVIKDYLKIRNLI